MAFEQAVGAATFDVAIVGAGLAGALAARALAASGASVALIERDWRARPEFRAEQLVGPQIAILERLGVLGRMMEGATPHPVTLTARAGRVIERTRVAQFGLSYDAMVAAVRSALPGGIRALTGRVMAIDAGPDLQRLTLADGQAVAARLVVLATGLQPALARQLGIAYRTIRACHSLTLGFDLAPWEHGGAGSVPLVYYPTTTRDRIDYLAVFAMGSRLRANLFGYQAPDSEWIRRFRRDPAAGLRAGLPGLERLLGPVAVASPVEIRSNDLRVVDEPAQDGLVLIGDAFQTPCPSAGTGIDRLLSDVDALARHAPLWLASPGMGWDKLAAYYADPSKRTSDAESLRIAEYRRSVSVETTLAWRFHRTHVLLRRSLRSRAAGVLQRRAAATAGLAPR